MKRVSIVAAGVLFAAVTLDGWALGLGELARHSYLKEPFRAEVALLESDALDDRDVFVGLASEVEFERLGVFRDFFLTRINFQVESDEFGRRVLPTTEAPLREPYLDLVVEARWPDGRLLREYSVLIDLPPRPLLAEHQEAPVETTAEFYKQAMVSDAGATSAKAGGYATDGAMQPTPGAQYLVTNTDTLWRIALEGAVAGISVQQTMLEIVAANPTAFEAGNINGLKSGYMLQIPDFYDIQIDPEAAFSEVALQNEEWAQSIVRESQGLTLVADGEAEAAKASASGDPDTHPDPAHLVESDAEPANQGPLNVPGTSTAADLEALIMTVSRLKESVASLEAKLAERDAELASFRSAFAEQQAAASVPTVMGAPTAPSAQLTSVAQAIPLRPFLLGLATLSAGAALLIWWRIRRNAESKPTDHADLKDAHSAEEIDEASSPSRFSDPQVLASKTVEEAQTYIAFGRTDQAVEVLNDALAAGLTSAALNMCLLECYVELEQFVEADALLERMKQGDNPELLERARQMLRNAGIPLISPSGDAVAERTKDRAAESRETAAGSVTPEDGKAAAEASPGTLGLPPTPLDDDTDTAEAPVAEGFDLDESIYGVETNPVDSKLDLARAYLDMGDEDGARPVLMEVIKEGDLAQQAEARELFLRLEAP